MTPTDYPEQDGVGELAEVAIKINAEDIVSHLQASNFNYSHDVGVTEFCPYGEGRRIDMFYFSRWNRQTRGYEVKISRADFLKDKKWESYLKFCSLFYFVAPEGVIKPSELPPNIGLLEISVVPDPEWSRKNEHEELGYHLEHKYTKKARNLGAVAEKEYIQLLEGLLIKLVYRKNLIK